MELHKYPLFGGRHFMGIRGEVIDPNRFIDPDTGATIHSIPDDVLENTRPRPDLYAMTDAEWQADKDDGLLRQTPREWQKEQLEKREEAWNDNDMMQYRYAEGALGEGFRPEKEVFMAKEELAEWYKSGESWIVYREWMRKVGMNWEGGRK